MKFILITTFILFLSTLQAQPYSCDSFCVKNIYIDTAGQMIVSIHFAGDENDYINYPHIDAVISASGDTVAQGELWFFGQVGGTTSEHPAATTLDEIPDGFTANVHFRYDDTLCVLSYPCMTTSVDIITDRDLSISPNPMTTHAFISLDHLFNNGVYRIYNLQGLLLKENYFAGQEIYLERGNLISGLYILVIQSGNTLLRSRILVTDLN